MRLSEHVYCSSFKMSEWVEQRVYMKLCIMLEHSSVETIQMIQKASAMCNWWLAASSQQCAHSCITSCAEFGKTSNHPDDSALLQPRYGALWLQASPKTKITFERKEISLLMRFRKIQWGSWWQLRTVWGPKVPTLKGTEASLSCVRCFLYLVSSSINVSIFHVIWLHTFWTDLVY